ncbi:MAG: phosphate ABC transporter permease PstA [Gammaproteobacteria bacterium]
MKSSFSSITDWVKGGTPWIWLTAGAVSISLVMVAGLLLLIAARGLGQFWPGEIISFEYQDRNESINIIGEVVEHETVQAVRLRDQGVEIPEGTDLVDRYLIKSGNRDQGSLDFQWILDPGITQQTIPQEVIVIEREEWGNFYGYLDSFSGNTISDDQSSNQNSKQENIWESVQASIEYKQQISEQIKHIEKDLIGSINYKVENLRLDKRRLELDQIKDKKSYELLDQKRAELDEEYKVFQDQLVDLYTEINRDSIQVSTSDGKKVEIPISKVRRIYKPNKMNTFEKITFYFTKIGEFIFDDPREANTEGGIFPAIFGTVLMVMIMAVLVTPFGVIAAIYLHEYANKGPLTRVIRIAVNNLAGVPSVVYGVFGLGFFVYFLGGNIDQLFFPEALPSPTFGTPGLMWSSLTLAILTVPVVIVATEEGLSRIPRSIREGSLALGATKAETLWRTVLPMATPAMMTGLILAVARAAGEVAPLMMVGVVKLAPSLALDGNSPFLHLDRKFMHLGFHIYDVGFQSPNVEAARPLVYATALALVVLIITLNFAAIKIRNHLREKYISAAQ